MLSVIRDTTNRVESEPAVVHFPLSKDPMIIPERDGSQRHERRVPALVDGRINICKVGASSRRLEQRATFPSVQKTNEETIMSIDYTITVRGHLDDHWSTWFDGITIRNGADGETTLSG